MKARLSTYEIEGLYGFRHVDIHIIADMEYDRDGYFDIRKLWVWSSRRNEMIEASERLTLKFQETKWSYLYEKCLAHSDSMAEYYREQRLCMA